LGAPVGTEPPTGLGAATGDLLGTATGVLLGDALGSPLGFLDDSDEGNCEASTLGDLLGCSVVGR
jgi:hypothetical protein